MADRVVVLGVMGQSPFAGVAWQVLHYLVGFQRLGYDVHYVEDTGEWPYDPVRNTVCADSGYAVKLIGRLMAWAGLPGRWTYRNAAQGGRVYGRSESQFHALLAGADVLVNLTGATVLREEHLRVPVRIYLETDPVRPQVELARRHPVTVNLLAAHTTWATYGENLGASDCLVPDPGGYVTTRQPVVLEWWTGGDGAPDAAFTTVASWRQSGKDVEWQGERYAWSKHHEFLKFVDLPPRVTQPLELALARVDGAARALLTAHGWRVRDALPLSADIETYRAYIRASGGEFTVAKDQNVRLRSGWFSDRSACYLAAGRPVITQDTAFGNVLPTGLGLFAFRSIDDVVAALDAVRTEPAKHAHAAREIAAEYFAAERVLTDLMAAATTSSRRTYRKVTRSDRGK